MNNLFNRVGFAIFKRSFILLSILYVSLTDLTCAQSWTQLTTTGISPPYRASHTAIYDAKNNQMIIFAGYGSSSTLNDVWALSNANGLGGSPIWTQINPSGNAPSPRYEHTAVFDTTNNNMTIFGGSPDGMNFFNDVLVLNFNGFASSWTKITTTGSNPTTRFAHSAVYDNTNNRMIIFGGFGGANAISGNALNDVWVLSHANGQGGTSSWTQLTTTGSAPTTRNVHTAVYDETNNRMIIFGGFVGTYLNDVWVLSNANGLGGTPAWTEITTSGNKPVARAGHTAIYDSGSNRMTIYGGSTANSLSGDLNDVWVLNNANGLGGTPAWLQITTTGSSPTSRAFHSAIYDTSNNRMTIYRGNIGDSTAWVLSNANGLVIPQAGFYGTPTTGWGPLIVNFIDTSFNSSTNWNWNFGDGISTGFTLSSTTTHIYSTVQTPTTYTVQLIVSNSFGTTTSTQNNYISVFEPGPTAAFIGSPLSGYGPLTVYFSDSSYSLYGNNTSWNWSFGDGSSSNSQNPTHVYGTVGVTTAYTVQLIATTNFGMNTSILTNYITVLPPPSVEDWKLYSTELDNSQFYLRRE